MQLPLINKIYTSFWAYLEYVDTATRADIAAD